MGINRKRLYSLRNAIALLLAFLVASSACPLASPPAVNAGSWPGWSSINTIYYNPSQDDSTNKFLEKAATELKDHLQKAGKNLTITTSSRPGPGSIYLEVNPAHPDLAGRNDEAFKLYSDDGGIYITGKTPLAARHGAYALLEKLGFRWFFKNPAWWVVPDTLISLDSLNEVQEPFYLWRSLWMVGIDGDKTADWTARNRLYGAKHYFIDQTYNKIIPATEYQTHPDWFLHGSTIPNGTSGWQLQPDNPDVVAKAKEYARKLLSATAYHSWLTIANRDKFRYYAAIPISPNDGGPNWQHAWDPYDIYKDTDWQTITNKVFFLANEVAKDIQADYPGTYISLLSYVSMNGTPTFPAFALQPNLLAVVCRTDAANRTPQTLSQQIDGLLAKGIQVGVYDFLEGAGSTWVNNNPGLNLDKVQALTSYAQKGVKFFNGEIGDGWAGKGLTGYTASKMLWNPFQNLDDILTDFYDKAFGPAQTVMKHYYEKGQSINAVGANFSDLAVAESLVAGNSAYLERIRQLEYYQRFLWLWHVKKISNLGLDELKNFYTFVNKIRDLYIINYRVNEPALRDELKNRGLADLQINALQDFTPPTAAEATAWLNEALTAFNVVITPPVTTPTPTTVPASKPAPTPTPEPLPAPTTEPVPAPPSPSPAPSAPPVTPPSAGFPWWAWAAIGVAIAAIAAWFVMRRLTR